MAVEFAFVGSEEMTKTLLLSEMDEEIAEMNGLEDPFSGKSAFVGGGELFAGLTPRAFVPSSRQNDGLFFPEGGGGVGAGVDVVEHSESRVSAVFLDSTPRPPPPPPEEGWEVTSVANAAVSFMAKPPCDRISA